MKQDYPDPEQMEACGFSVMVDDVLGHLAVTHDGSITWDQLQAVKNHVWGQKARAIEVYPVQHELVNNAHIRHLWRLGDDDFCPDLLGRPEPKQTLERRYHKAWED